MTKEVSSSARSCRATAFRRGCRSSTLAPTHRSKIDLSERVGRTFAAMVRCMLADSGPPKFLWGELMFTAAFLGNRAPHSARHAVSVQNAALDGAGSAISSSHRCLGLRAHQDVLKTLNSRRWKDDWWGTATTARAIGCTCLLYTSPSPRDGLLSRMPSSA